MKYKFIIVQFAQFKHIDFYSAGRNYGNDKSLFNEEIGFAKGFDTEEVALEVVRQLALNNNEANLTILRVYNLNGQ